MSLAVIVEVYAPGGAAQWSADAWQHGDIASNRQSPDSILHELELCRANGDVVQTYTEWMNDNQPQLKNVRLASLGLGILGVGVGFGVWNTNQSLGQPTVVLGGVTSVFAATTFWIDRPTPMIEQAFVSPLPSTLSSGIWMRWSGWRRFYRMNKIVLWKALTKGECCMRSEKSCERSMFS